MRRFFLRIFRWGAVLLLVVVFLLVARGVYAFRDRMPGSTFDLKIDPAKSRAEPRPLQVGFGRVKINPDLSDPKRPALWNTGAGGSEAGDRAYSTGPVWLAGFSQHRAATAIHDDLWAIACVLDDGHTRLGVVALDAIGFFHDDTLEVRRGCPQRWKLDYITVCSTHNHSTPDLMGLWGPDFLHTGVEARYRRQVIAAATKALGQAVKALQPARVAFHEIASPTEGLVADTRQPIVFDPDIRVMHFTSAANGTTLGSIVGWANHPETPWGRNTEITADFCGYLRDTLERGFTHEGRALATGVGGIHLYVNGAIGGLMTTHPSVTVRDPFLQQDFKEPSHEKARAVGHQLAARILPELAKTNSLPREIAPPGLPPATRGLISRGSPREINEPTGEDNQARSISRGEPTEVAPIGIYARTIEMPVDNKLFLAAAYLGLIDRGYVGWKTMRTEVALVTIGEASIACVPGEIYPEIINGGIERAPGGDFDIEPVEVPPLRELMPGRIKFVFGLANDELGYLIPKSEWDEKPPYLYGATGHVYGEVNSCGPDAALTIHAALAELCRENKSGGSNK